MGGGVNPIGQPDRFITVFFLMTSLILVLKAFASTYSWAIVSFELGNFVHFVLAHVCTCDNIIVMWCCHFVMTHVMWCCCYLFHDLPLSLFSQFPAKFDLVTFQSYQGIAVRAFYGQYFAQNSSQFKTSGRGIKIIAKGGASVEPSLSCGDLRHFCFLTSFFLLTFFPRSPTSEISVKARGRMKRR